MTRPGAATRYTQSTEPACNEKPGTALIDGYRIMGRGFAIAIALSVVVSSASFAGPREQARRIHDRLTGVPATDAMLDAM